MGESRLGCLIPVFSNWMNILLNGIQTIDGSGAPHSTVWSGLLGGLTASLACGRASGLGDWVWSGRWWARADGCNDNLIYTCLHFNRLEFNLL